MSALAEPINQRLEALERDMLRHEQVECPLVHEFAPHVYLRTVTIPAGTLAMGACHRTENFNLLWRGMALVSMNGEVQLLAAPCRFVGKPGVRKVVYAITEVEWSNIHATDETDVPTLEEMMVEKSGAFLEYETELHAMREYLWRALQ